MRVDTQYDLWRDHQGMPEDLQRDLESIRDDPDARYERFYQSLTFGTGGLRGRMGAGTNRMNEYTVNRASLGLAAWLKERGGLPSCAIGYDSRRNSQRFARVSAAALAEQGVRVHLFEELTPSPMLSFAVRYLRCDAGVMITASHNPSGYNGYKVYDATGCQVLDQDAGSILALTPPGDELPHSLPSFDALFEQGRIMSISREVFDAYHEAVMRLSVMSPPVALDVVYSPLHGTGLRPMRRVLGSMPNIHLSLVAAQETPDGNFPTVEKPNPEDAGAMAMAVAQMLEQEADICLVTDPDCDRLGVGLRMQDGHRLLSGDQIGALLFHFICEGRRAKGTMPASAVAVKTIVTAPMAEAIARHYGVKLYQVLTGFKYIGERINRLEIDGGTERFVLGFEESYGYLSGTHVRDKDAVNAAMLVCEMASYYKSVGSNLWEAYEALRERFGCYETALVTFTFEGAQGKEKMERIMAMLRQAQIIAGSSVQGKVDYLLGGTGLPRSDVLVFELEGERELVVRPSGTEPMLKLYLSLKAQGEQSPQEQIDAFCMDARAMIDSMG